MRTSILTLALFLFTFSLQAQDIHTVTQVIDGGTLVLDGNQTVVLLGAQVSGFAPTVSKDGKVKKPDSVGLGFADRAKQFTESMVMGRQVWLEYDKVKTNDQGQMLAYVFFKLDGAKSLGGGGSKVLLTYGKAIFNPANYHPAPRCRKSNASAARTKTI